MLHSSVRSLLALAVALACASPAAAQQSPDPLTRFLDGIFKKPQAPAGSSPQQAAPQAAPQQPAPRPQAQPQARTQPPTAKPNSTAQKPQTPPQRTAQPQPSSKPQPAPQTAAKPEPPRAPVTEKAETKPAAVPEPQKPAPEPPVQAAEPAKPAPPPPAKVAEPPKPARATPAQTVSAPTSVAAPSSAPTPTSPPGPRTPEEGLDRVNAYFNSLDVMSAYFVQKNPNGQQAEGTLSMRRPGQVHFAYAPPSTLEVISDGRNVAIRDKKLGTNDVYPVGQTPLKFLVQDNIDLARDTKVRDVQVGRDGVVTVRFDDSATLGGTSKITLRYDSRANTLKQWTIIDAQGYETSVTLSGVNATYRRDARAGQ
ncbi:outer-membrane lipoprotein carrier protein LolA [Microvirga sp. HBU67558]|uniref:LolA family protein n=1 Tax=Microvirga TaxID=186650 RepID=UPI001B39A106|nr:MULTISPECIES: outer-membrane lipoprotein carrier protein LolA [unclassified Microvirga]MBQ0824212.1 outer-membrane lipoprotein carrier protein LolA [Microvirga sp. HBU67558]